MVALPCGSRSTSRTRRPACASAAARLTLVVVLPTPPFWLTTASTRAISDPDPAQHQVALRIEQRHLQSHHLASGIRRRRSGALHRRQRAAGSNQVLAL